ncbi:MAG: hypothetical protein JWR14_7110 [Caballeronia sp.]|jgi:hypothetical protein|uniref:hypothetical protein n=1 Tax=Caballeronia sp. TaxID=1931223 RepID=UPI00260EB2E2|nr:hypothetical protein [Caballeronia sp.]MDB5837280.1 hypothetical protein [Caballeronia sp.]
MSSGAEFITHERGVLALKAVITSHMRVICVEAPALNQFGYRLFGNDGLLHEDTVTVRTARIFSAELAGSSAFMTMMTTIANADPRNYDVLVGSVFSD